MTESINETTPPEQQPTEQPEHLTITLPKMVYDFAATFAGKEEYGRPVLASLAIDTVNQRATAANGFMAARMPVTVEGTVTAEEQRILLVPTYVLNRAKRIQGAAKYDLVIHHLIPESPQWDVTVQDKFGSTTFPFTPTQGTFPMQAVDDLFPDDETASARLEWGKCLNGGYAKQIADLARKYGNNEAMHLQSYILDEKVPAVERNYRPVEFRTKEFRAMLMPMAYGGGDTGTQEDRLPRTTGSADRLRTARMYLEEYARTHQYVIAGDFAEAWQTVMSHLEKATGA